jgi:hypothetical protein
MIITPGIHSIIKPVNMRKDGGRFDLVNCGCYSAQMENMNVLEVI